MKFRTRPKGRRCSAGASAHGISRSLRAARPARDPCACTDVVIDGSASACGDRVYENESTIETNQRARARHACMHGPCAAGAMQVTRSRTRPLPGPRAPAGRSRKLRAWHHRRSPSSSTWVSQSLGVVSHSIHHCVCMHTLLFQRAQALQQLIGIHSSSR
jgi:hypothetical protein